MKKWLRGLLTFGSMVLVGSCAGYRVIPLEANDKSTAGIRYWRPAPYLLVSAGVDNPEKTAALATAGVGSPLTYQIIYLPDTTQSYAVQFHGGLGTAELALKLADGWNLTEINGKTDFKIPETITAVGSLLTAVVGAATARKAANPDASGNAKLGPGLYKIKLTPNGITLIGSKLAVN